MDREEIRAIVADELTAAHGESAQSVIRITRRLTLSIAERVAKPAIPEIQWIFLFGLIHLWSFFVSQMAAVKSNAAPEIPARDIANLYGNVRSALASILDYYDYFEVAAKEKITKDHLVARMAALLVAGEMLVADRAADEKIMIGEERAREAAQAVFDMCALTAGPERAAIIWEELGSALAIAEEFCKKWEGL